MPLSDLDTIVIPAKRKSESIWDLDDEPMVQTSVKEQQENPSFLGGLKESVIERGKKIEEIEASAPQQTKFETGLQKLGQGAGFVGDVGFEALKSAGRGIKAITPDIVEKGFAKTAKDIGGFAKWTAKGLTPDVAEEYISDLATMTVDEAKEWAKQHPRAIRNLQALGNIATGVLTVSPISKAPQAVETGLAGAKTVTEKALTAIPKSKISKFPSEIEEAIQKGIKPSVGQVKSAGGNKKYIDKAKTAVEEIVNNKKNLSLVDEVGEETIGELPKSVQQFSDSISQTKKSVFDKYNDLRKQAGETGAEVDLKNIAIELENFSKNPIIQDLNPEVINYANKRYEALLKRGNYTTEQAQDAIKNLNESLKSFYNNPSYESATRASVDAMIANRLRAGLDDVIEKSTGGQYQELKNIYGALKTIEKDVSQRAIIEGRKAPKGLIDFADIFSAGDLAAGLATMNSAFFAKAAAQKGIKEWFKFKNSPNSIIKRMFKKADEAINVAPEKIKKIQEKFKTKK